MPDLSNLKLTPEAVEVNFEEYVDASEFPPPIPEGIYTFVSEVQDAKAGLFSASKDKYLVATLKDVVSGGEFDGASITFDRISNKPFERSGVKVNMMTDFLRATGNTSRPRTHDEYAQAIETSLGRPWKGQVQWEAYCNHKDTLEATKDAWSLKGMGNFEAIGTSGQRNPAKSCPICGKEVTARSKINRRIPA